MTVDRLVDEVGDRLRVDADLVLEVDGRPLRLVAAGQQVTLHVTGPGDLARVATATPRDGRRRIASTLDDLGMTLVVEAPGGRLATVGRAASDGIAGRLLPAPVRPGPGAARPLLAAAAVAVVLVALARSWRRRRAG